MLPDYIKSEVARRVGAPTIELARSLGIDPDAQPGEPDDRLRLPPRDFPPVNEGPVIRGTLPFDVTITCMGKSTAVECRVRYILTLDDIPEARGRAGRSISRLMFTYDALEWRNLNDFDPAAGEHRRMELPQWVPIKLDLLLHPQLLRQIQDLVEDEAREIERRRALRTA
jgi:hypothetical protein